MQTAWDYVETACNGHGVITWNYLCTNVETLNYASDDGEKLVHASC